MKITLQKACILIENISHKKIYVEVLRQKIKNGRWIYPSYQRKLPHINLPITLLDVDDVLKFAKNYAGSKIGRPPGAKNKNQPR